MDQTMYSFNIRDAIKSFKFFSRTLKLLWSIRRLHLILIIILQLISGLLPAIVTLSTQWLLNSIQNSVGKEFVYVLYPFIVYLLLNLIAYIFAQLSNYLQSMYRIDLDYKISLMILNKAKELSLSDFENAELYDKLRRAQSEAIDRPFAIFSNILGFLSQILGLVSFLAILLYWKSWVSLIILIVPIISTLYMAKIGHMQYKIEFERAQEKRKSWYLSYLLTNDIAFKEIKIYGIGNYFIESYKKLRNKLIKQDRDIIKKRATMSLVFEVLDQITSGFVLLLIVYSAYLGEILIGNTVAYIRSISSVKGNVQGILSSITIMYQNNLYVKQLYDFLDIPTNRSPKKEEYIRIKEIKNIEFIGVSFKYPNRKDYALKDISFKINKGENISLVGENGSGKTTLIKLLVGLYNDFEGEILINGISIKKIDMESYSEKIGVIFQDYNKYELSCRENIGLGKLDYMNNDIELNRAINKSYASEMINKLPNGVETQLGVWFDDGVQLSGGQWQRIALSRAFLRHADCYILDEPSSSLDPVSEHEIFKRTLELTKNKISLFISHRLYNIRKVSSRIFVLKDGKLIEEGTHEELMHLNGHYKYLYDLQNESDLVESIECSV